MAVLDFFMVIPILVVVAVILGFYVYMTYVSIVKKDLVALAIIFFVVWVVVSGFYFGAFI